jgi:hypothetical protein
MTPTTCPIWGTPARELPRISDRREIISPCAGGWYVIFGPADAMLARQPLDNREKILLTDWLMGQRRDGEDCPLVTSWVLETVVGRRGATDPFAPVPGSSTRGQQRALNSWR